MRRSRSKLPSLFAGVVFIVSAFGCDSRQAPRTSNSRSAAPPAQHAEPTKLVTAMVPAADKLTASLMTAPSTTASMTTAPSTTASMTAQSTSRDAQIQPGSENHSRVVSPSAKEEALAEIAVESAEASGQLTSAETALPSPGRTNAFEFTAGTVAGLDQTAASELRVIGFVDAGQPSVMLVIDKQTHVLSASQSVEHVTVQSIDPPLVHLTNHGAPQTLSLFDH